MDEIDKILNDQVENDKTPSVSYLIFDEDKILHSYQKGQADILNQKKVNENTTYCGFSVTKTFTALAILQLVEQGKISLDDKAKDYVKSPYSESITIKQLLSHSAGIPNPLPLKWVHSNEERPNFNRNEFFHSIFKNNHKGKFEPNDKFSYSNLGYVLLGQIIENLSGLSYEAFIQKNIIGSLDISERELGFDILDKTNHAKGYQKRISIMNFVLGFLMDKSKFVNQKEGKWNSFHDMYLNGPAHGGLIGKPTSFMRYIQELLKDDCVLISDKYKELLFTENLTNSDKETGMCLSWFKGNLSGHTYFCHAGGGGGYYCEIRIYPALKKGSAIFFNRTGMSDERFLDKLDKYFIN